MNAIVFAALYSIVVHYHGSEMQFFYEPALTAEQCQSALTELAKTTVKGAVFECRAVLE